MLMLPDSLGHTLPSDISSRKAVSAKSLGFPCKRSSVHVAIPRQSRLAQRLVRLQSTEQGLEQSELHAPAPSVAEEGLPNESYSRFKVGMLLACRVSHLRPGAGAFVYLLPTDWAETVPPKMAYLPQSEFTYGAPEDFAIENVLSKGALIKALIFKISTRGILVTTRALEQQAGDMLSAPLDCFERARGLEVGQILPAGSWQLSEMPQSDNPDENGEDNQAKKRKKSKKKLRRKEKTSGKFRVVIIGQQVTKQGRMMRRVRTAAGPLQPFQGAPQALLTSSGMETKMRPYIDAAEDVMAQHVQQALLAPPSLLELQPESPGQQGPPSPSSEPKDMFPAIHSLATARVQLRSVPGGADALVPQHSLHPRSMGQAPHEPASVTMRSCSLVLEGELISSLINIMGLPQNAVEQGGWDRDIPQGWGRTSFVSAVARFASDLRRTFPDQKRWSMVVRDACMGASSRILALTDVPQGAAYGVSSGSLQPSDSLSENSPGEKVNGMEQQLERRPRLVLSGQQAAFGRWHALASSLLQLAKADLLSMPVPSSSEGLGYIRASDLVHSSSFLGAFDKQMSSTELLSSSELYSPGQGLQEERQQEQREIQEAKQPHADTMRTHPALLPSLGLIAGVGGGAWVNNGVESDGRSLSSIWSSAGLDLFEDPVKWTKMAGDQGFVSFGHAEGGHLSTTHIDRESQGEKQKEKKEMVDLSCVLRSSPHTVDVLEFLVRKLRDSCVHAS